jgi:hypothetical protein
MNAYMSKRLSERGHEDLCQDVLDDAEEASEFGVESDRDHHLFFHVNHLTDELLKDTFDLDLSDDELTKLKHYVFGFRDDPNYDLTSLVDLRILLHKGLVEEELTKKAHPNISGFYSAPKQADVGKWITAAKSVYDDVNAGIGRNLAFNKHTSDWDRDEVHSFSMWLKYYEERTPEKYNVKNANIIKTAFGPTSLTIPDTWVNPANRQNITPFNANDSKTKKELEQDRAKVFKSKMKSRLRSLKLLMDKYNDLLPHQNLDKMYDELVVLEKSIGKMNVYAALQDRVIRSANVMTSLGFDDGAAFLKTAAEEPIRTDETNLPAGQLKSDVETVINRLEGASKSLKMRELIRELSKADIMLDELGMASFFPEISDSIAKMIESYTYASNRLESVIAKLRGTGKVKAIPGQKHIETPAEIVSKPGATPAPLPAGPTIPIKQEPPLEVEELHERPMGTMQTKLPTQPVAAPKQIPVPIPAPVKVP